ncbi:MULTISPECIES: DMT family transporter [unclassified Bradyrhizobium]|uniref:DMT family transporter n=1 Tax=unclassified Bradyrhizobium TaxID=2631580 RepID=UPI0029170A5B|nr:MULTISPECIES: DMT family transporter [unclassified Bradyrhizobium]
MLSLRGTSAVAAIAATVASCANGAQLAVTRLIVQRHDPLAIAFLRCAIAAACLAPLLRKSQRPPAQDCATILALGGVVAGLCPWLLTIAMQYTTASRGALVICTSPLLTLTFAAMLGQEKCTLRRVAGCCCALIGVAVGLSGQLATGAPMTINRGDAVVLLTTVLLALFNVCAARMLTRYPAHTIAPIACFGGLVILFAFTLADGALGGLPLLAAKDWLAVLFCGTVGGAGVLLLWSWAIEQASAARIAIFVTAAPISAAAAGVILLAETVSPQLTAGIGLILAGIYLVYRVEPFATSQV